MIIQRLKRDSSDAAYDEARIKSSEAPLLDHLIEFRRRLISALVAFVAIFFVCFHFSGKIYDVLVWPYVWASGSDNVKLIATHFLEQIVTQIKLAIFGAAFLSFPIVATQLYKFIAPGLYRKERGAVLPYLFAAPVLFLVGSMVVYFVAMPVIIRFSINLAHAGGENLPAVDLLPRVSEYLSLIMSLMLGFGIMFQLPVVLTLAARAGFISSNDLRQGRRYAIVLIFAVAAFFTPPDVLSMVIMAMPTLALYECSIIAVSLLESKRRGDRMAHSPNPHTEPF